jgi:hypothetical protein
MFATSLKTDKIGTKEWVLTDDLVFNFPNPVEVKCKGQVYTLDTLVAPQGAHTDGASAPQFLWRVAPPMTGDHAEPSVMHDYIYRTEMFPRYVCDVAYRLMLMSNGVGTVKSNVMYAGVRAGGWATWSKDHSFASLENARMLLPDHPWEPNRFAVELFV